MLYKNLLSVFVLLILAACNHNNQESTALSPADFTPINQIDPNTYFPTSENIAVDPQNELMEIFRKKKAADMADSTKPRPFAEDDLAPLENISHQQDWTPVEEVFQFEWENLTPDVKDNLAHIAKTRLIFDHPDLKVVELAVAAGASLPFHTQPTPSVFHVLGGEAEIIVSNSIAKVFPGSSAFFDSYATRIVHSTGQEPLKILWFSWAPQGDTSYLTSGYYLTGSNLHLQPIEAVLPEKFDFWGKETGKEHEFLSSPSRASSTTSISELPDWIHLQLQGWDQAAKKKYYPQTPTFRSASTVDWVDVVNLDPKSFFFAKDIQKLGGVLNMLSRIAKIKSVFRVNRPDEGYDLNYSYLAWGPHSKYVTHSHAICEFYYLLDGDVEYIINGQEFHAVPGNFYFHPPYYDHEMRGLKKNVPFLSISGSWIPFGDRSLFEKPFYLLGQIEVPEGVAFPEGFDFHDFNLKQDMAYGMLE